MIRFAQKFQER